MNPEINAIAHTTIASMVNVQATLSARLRSPGLDDDNVRSNRTKRSIITRWAMPAGGRGENRL